jgi:hypothetical protein
MLHRRSNGLKTCQRSHVDRLQIGRQRRVGLPWMVGTRQRHSALFVLATLPDLRSLIFPAAKRIASTYSSVDSKRSRHIKD